MLKSTQASAFRLLLLSTVAAFIMGGRISAAAAPLPALPDTLLKAMTPADTAKRAPADTTRHMRALADSLLAADTLGRMSTPALVGTDDRSLDSARYLTRENLNWMDYRYLGGILRTMPGVFILDQNNAGSYDQLSIRGTDWRSIAVTENGRPLNGPSSGIFNLYHFTTEYADRIEVITGPRAFLYGLNSTGGVINLVTRNYNSNRPFTKINYSEGTYNYMYSDGTFSQNISRKINFTFGFQHQGTDGRYQNSTAEAWNMRVKTRYNVSRDFNIILSEYLTNTDIQFNGGVDLAHSGATNAFLPQQAVVVNTLPHEKVTRHDVDLSFVGTFLPDTVNVSTLTLYYSHDLREYRDEENLLTPFGDMIRSDHVSSWMGATFTQNLDTDLERFSFGSTLELRQIEGSPNLGRRRNVIGDLWAKEELLLDETLTVAGYGRYDNYLRNSYFGAGADATLRLGDRLSFFGGTSYSRRVPNYAELHWSDSTVSRIDPITAEKHWQSEAGVEVRLPGAGSARISLFHRTVTDPIRVAPATGAHGFPGVLWYNGNSVSSFGVEAGLSLKLWLLTAEGTGMYLLQKSGGETLREYPRFSASGGIYFWNKVLQDKLDIKVGLRGRFTSRFDGDLFNPEVLTYVPNLSAPVGLSSSADFFLIARIGDAYIHLIWENLTDVQYFATPYYPGLDRALRIAIFWEFLN